MFCSGFDEANCAAAIDLGTFLLFIALKIALSFNSFTLLCLSGFVCVR